MSTYLFEDLGRALNKIAQKLCKNESLGRLLTDMSSNPLDQSKDYDITTNPLLEKNIRIKPKVHPNECTQAFVIISIPEFETGDNMDFNDATLAIDVICPIDNWLIDDICPRPYKIMSQVYEELQGSRVTGIGTLEFVGALQNVIYEDVTDHQMIFTVTANG